MMDQKVSAIDKRLTRVENIMRVLNSDVGAAGKPQSAVLRGELQALINELVDSGAITLPAGNYTSQILAAASLRI